MAANASPEASEIRRRGRRRLIGAIAIVVVLVVFVPMVLDSEPKTARQEPVLAIPPKENAPALPPPVPAKSAELGAAPRPAAADPRPAPAAKSAAVETKPAGAPAKPAARPAPPVLEGFAVQVGAFRDEDKLRQAREKVVGSGFAHYTEKLDGSAGALTRLRAGPFKTREAADAALAKLREIAPEGKVVPLP